MSRSPSAKNAKWKNNKRKSNPLVQGTTVLQILCGILLLLNLWLLYGLFSPSDGIFHCRRHRRQVEALERKTQNLRAENQKLFKRIEDFKNDPAMQEKIVRQQLGWARQGELVIEFLSPQK